MNGKLCSVLEGSDGIEFVHIASAVPSMSVECDNRVVNLRAQTNMTLDIEMENMSHCTVRASVQQKTPNGYIDNAHYIENIRAGDLVIELGAYASLPGSYRVLFTVSDDVTTIMQIPYYFIIQN